MTKKSRDKALYDYLIDRVFSQILRGGAEVIELRSGKRLAHGERPDKSLQRRLLWTLSRQAAEALDRELLEGLKAEEAELREALQRRADSSP